MTSWCVYPAHLARQPGNGPHVTRDRRQFERARKLRTLEQVTPSSDDYMMFPLVRLIMQSLRVPEEIARIILGYIPVRRRLTVRLPSRPPGAPFADLGGRSWFVYERPRDEWEGPWSSPTLIGGSGSEGGSGSWGYLQ